MSTNSSERGSEPGVTVHSSPSASGSALINAAMSVPSANVTVHCPVYMYPPELQPYGVPSGLCSTSAACVNVAMISSPALIVSARTSS